MKAYTFRLYPTDAQIERLDWTLARCCELYNAALQERKDAWNACKKHPNFSDATWREEQARAYSVNFVEQCRAQYPQAREKTFRLGLSHQEQS